MNALPDLYTRFIVLFVVTVYFLFSLLFCYIVLILRSLPFCAFSSLHPPPGGGGGSGQVACGLGFYSGNAKFGNIIPNHNTWHI